MRCNKLFYLTILFFLIFQSCTIEKRLHNRGYYVEWRKYKSIDKNSFDETKVKAEKSDQNLENKAEVNSSLDQSPNSDYSIDYQQTNIVEKEEINKNISHQTEKNSIDVNNNNSGNLKFKLKQKNNTKKITTRYDKKKSDSGYNKLAIISLILAASSLFLFFTIIPAFFVSSIALRQIKANPSKYSNKYAAIIAYTFSLIVIALAIILLVSLFSAFGSITLLNIAYITSTFLFFVVLSQVIINT